MFSGGGDDKEEEEGGHNNSERITRVPGIIPLFPFDREGLQNTRIEGISDTEEMGLGSRLISREKDVKHGQNDGQNELRQIREN